LKKEGDFEEISNILLVDEKLGIIKECYKNITYFHQRRTISLFRVDTPPSSSETNVYVFGTKDCFSLKCGIEDTFKILMNKILKETDSSEILLYVIKKNADKSMYLRYNLNDEVIIKNDEYGKEHWNDGIIICFVEKDEHFEMLFHLINERERNRFSSVFDGC
jgi:hypothetical protein